MNLNSILLLLAISLFLVLLFQVQETSSLYPYAIRGLVADVRANPLRFIGGLFFKKAFLLKKAKLKWKLKKKFVLKKLLKKLFLAKSVLFRLSSGSVGRKRRAVRFPDEGNASDAGLGSTSFPGPINPGHRRDETSSSSSSSSSSRTFFDDESFSEFESIGLGQHELDLLRQLPENLQYEYKQEMQELETSSSEPREEEIVNYLSATNEFDNDHCIAKGICEVMARGNTTSNQFESLLLAYYNEEPDTRKEPNGAYIYDYAAFLGKSSRNLRACSNYFPKCPEPTHQLTQFMNEIFTSEMCDPPVTNELTR